MGDPGLRMDQPWESPATSPFLKRGLDPTPPSWLFVCPVSQSCGICRRWQMLQKSTLAIWKLQTCYLEISLRLNLKRKVTRTPKLNYSFLQSGVHILEITWKLHRSKIPRLGWTAGNHCQLSVSKEPNASFKPVKIMGFFYRGHMRD